MGTQLPSPEKRDRAPNFRSISVVAKQLDASRCHLVWRSALAYMPLRDIVFDVDPATPEKGHTHPTQFLAHVYCGQISGIWMDEDAAWYGSRPRLRPHRTRRGPSSRERGTAAPLFGPCLLWPRSPISATAELLLKLASSILHRLSFSNLCHQKF